MSMTTDLYMIKDSRLSLSQNHTMNFGSKSEQFAYWSGKSNHYGERAAVNLSGGTFDIRVPFSELEGVDYMAVRFGGYTDKTYYYFVTNVIPRQKGMSTIHYEVDVLQTYLFEVKDIGISHVAQEHVSRYDGTGAPIVKKTPEKIPATNFEIKRLTRQVGKEDERYLRWISIYTTSPIMESEKPRASGVQLSFYQYYIPFDIRYPEKDIKVKSAGFEGRIPKNVDKVLQKLDLATGPRKDPIKLIEIKEAFPFDGIVYKDGTLFVDESKLWLLDLSGVITGFSDEAIIGASHKSIYRKDPLEVVRLENKYAGLEYYGEPRLLAPPYTQAEVITPTGERLPFNLSDIRGDVLSVRAMTNADHMNAVQVFVENYRSAMNTGVPYVDGLTYNTGRFLEYGGSHVAEIMRSSGNAIISAGGFLATGGLARMSMAAADSNFNYDIKNEMSKTDLPSMQKIEEIADDYSSRYEQYEEVQGSAAAGFASAATNIMNTVQSTYVSMSPGVIGKTGMGMDVKGASQEFQVIVYQPDSETMRELADYFKMYGNTVNRLKRPNFETRESYNYVRIINPHIWGDIPQRNRVILENLLSRGITLWHTSRIGDYNLNNKER